MTIAFRALLSAAGAGEAPTPAAFVEIMPTPSEDYPSATAGKPNAIRTDGDPGASNYLTAAYDAALLPSTTALTVEWRGILHSNTSGVTYTIVELTYGASAVEPHYVYAIQVQPSARSLAVQANISGTRRTAFLGSLPGIAAGTPMHLAFTYDGATLTGYLNGRVVCTASHAGSIVGSNRPLFIGRRGNSTTGAADLTTDMVRIWGEVRTQAQLLANMEHDPVDTTNLSAHWRMNEGSGTTIADEIGSNDLTVVGTGSWVTSLVWDGSNDERFHFPTVLDLPTPYSTIEAIHPSMIYVPGGLGGYSWWAAYTPYPGGDFTKENPCIAASNDGVTWVEPDGISNPISSPASGYNHSDPNLVAVNDNGTPTLWVFFREAPSSSGGDETIYRMTSTNGVTWGDKTAVLSDASGTNVDNIMSPTVFYDASAGEWVMLAVNFTAGQIQRRTSSDGVTWSAASAVTLNNLPADNSAWHLEARVEPGGTNVHIVLQTRNDLATWPTREGRIYYGVSSDAGATITLTGTPITNAKHATFAFGEYRTSLVFDPTYRDRLHLYMSGYRVVDQIYTARITRRLASGDLYQENAGPL